MLGGQITSTLTTSVPTGEVVDLFFNSEVYDPHGLFSGTPPETSRFISPGGGWVVAFASAALTAAPGGRRDIYLLHKFTIVAIDRRLPSAVTDSLSLAWQGRVAAGDQIKVQMFQDSGSSIQTVNIAGRWPLFSVTFLPDVGGALTDIAILSVREQAENEHVLKVAQVALIADLKAIADSLESATLTWQLINPSWPDEFAISTATPFRIYTIERHSLLEAP